MKNDQNKNSNSCRFVKPNYGGSLDLIYKPYLEKTSVRDTSPKLIPNLVSNVRPERNKNISIIFIWVVDWGETVQKTICKL